MPNKTFPAGYIKRTIVIPERLKIPVPAVEKPAPLRPEVAVEVKPPSYIPWVIAGASVFFALCAILRRK